MRRCTPTAESNARYATSAFAAPGRARIDSGIPLDNEIPRGDRSGSYRFFEMLPALLSFGVPLLAILLSFIDLRIGMLFVVAFVGMTLIRAVRGGIDAFRGYRRMRSAERIDWAALVAETDAAVRTARACPGTPVELLHGPATRDLPEPFAAAHAALLLKLSVDAADVPLPSRLVHAVIVAAYNEPFEVIEPSIRSLAESSGAERLVVVFAYEERGGAGIEASADRLRDRYASRFAAFLAVEHPSGLADEIAGKGANITFAARKLRDWLRARQIPATDVMVTTLDCDNRVPPDYFANVTYAFVSDVDRAQRSYQPISTFVNNLWHAPAPTRVVAAGNTLWNLISTVRPHSLRNFASHSQPMSALIAMDYWSRRTIVEDGHQYWRSYFHFDGRYAVTPIHLPISQDAVLGESFGRTLHAQFKQLCRWAYGASDIAFVGTRLFSKDRRAPLAATLSRFVTLLDSHVTLASVAPMVAFGAWIPILVGSLSGGAGTPLAILLREAGSASASAAEWATRALGIPFASGAEALRASAFSDPNMLGHLIATPPFSIAQLAAELPGMIGSVQRVALVGVAVTIVLTLLLTPERPEGVSRMRSVGMLAQWILLPVTLLCYNTMSAIVSQYRLLIGAYREDFDVTEKRAPNDAVASGAGASDHGGGARRKAHAESH
ncbi:hypothetical protein [Leucobacter sp. NPDC077196]|uniref:glycosyltransferase n=1 Tax=Leucobacter sp. NPDC077196 TaxID=3154959 RepID=UPI00341F3753